jgi:hypothetical protein
LISKKKAQLSHDAVSAGGMGISAVAEGVFGLAMGGLGVH